ncbi:MAG: hypothetical protein JSW66_06905, partial [Phycisphaerales bacterium]
TEEEETVQAAFKAIDDRGKAIEYNLVAQLGKGSHESSSGPGTLRQMWEGSTAVRRIAKFAAAAVIIIGVFAGIYHFGGSNVAWADVVEKFRSVPFFSAAIYIKEDVTSEPKQMELWMSRTGKTRMRIGTQVIFGDRGEVVEAFDIETRARVEADDRAALFLKKIGEADEFSLDSIIRVMFGGTMQDVTPLVNPDAVMSQDMVVFDVELPGTPEWVRIWALRESRLPVRIRIRDPRDGDLTDAVFEYSKDQAEKFFDPNAFESLLQSGRTSNRTNIVYAFLKDPGGRNITPEEMFKESGYHMPVIKQAGMTEDGAFWVTAGKGRNRTPSGRVFDGFSRIQDDLGRTYFSVGGGHRLRDDTSQDIFVPIDFPFDDRKPSKITLFCEAKNYNPNTKPELVGTAGLTEWKQNAHCPNLFGPGYKDTLSLKISLAHRLFADEHADRLNRLLQAIPKWSEQPRNMSLLLFWTRKLYAKKDYGEVIRIGRAVSPLMLKKPREVDRYSFRCYLIALGVTGRIDEAAQLFKQIDAIDDMSPEKSNAEHYNRFVHSTAEFLVAAAYLTPDQISKILGFDISQRKEYKCILERAKHTAANRKARLAAERRIKEISHYYETHPLPDRMQLLERPGNEAIYLVGVSNTVPNHEDYKFLPINCPISGLASNLRIHGDVQPYELVTIRVEDDAAEQELFADLIYKDGISLRERAEFVLGLFGMELLVEDGESRQVLVATHDGRKLKDPPQVKAPFPYDRNRKSKAGMMSTMAKPGFSMTNLLYHFALQQNEGLEDDSEKLVIVNETQIEGPVSSERAFWPGDEGLKLAYKWFKDEFGVTFTEENRTMKTYVIRELSQQ